MMTVHTAPAHVRAMDTPPACKKYGSAKSTSH